MKGKINKISLYGEFENRLQLEEIFADILTAYKNGAQDIKLERDAMRINAFIHEKKEESEDKVLESVLNGAKWQVINGESCLVIPSRLNFEECQD